ncbi:MAG: hypothetical protein IPK82_23180 [Polyangiaceae bacterium]|nr:hypothetical protein [Polyangiaceae bacterium]
MGLFVEIGSLGLVINIGNVFTAAKTVVTLNDNRWHVVRGLRQGLSLSVFIDGVLRGSGSTGTLVDIQNNARVFIAANTPCVSGLGQYFIGDIANVSIYVDTLPGPLCTTNGTNYFGSLTQSAQCNRIVGFCNESRDTTRPCCAVANCLECNSYRSCSRTATTTAATATTTISSISTTRSATTTMSSPSTSATPLSLSIGATSSDVGTVTTTPSQPSSTVLPATILVPSTAPPGWIFGAAAGGVVALLLIIGAIGLACWCNKRAAAASLSGSDAQLTSLSHRQTGIRRWLSFCGAQ